MSLQVCHKEGELIDHVKRLEISSASFKNIFRYMNSSFSMLLLIILLITNIIIMVNINIKIINKYIFIDNIIVINSNINMISY